MSNSEEQSTETRCTCDDLQIVSKTCQNCKLEWDEDMYYPFKVMSCKSDHVKPAICIGMGPIGDLCQKCRDEGYYMGGTFWAPVVKNRNEKSQ